MATLRRFAAMIEHVRDTAGAPCEARRVYSDDMADEADTTVGPIPAPLSPPPAAALSDGVRG